MATKFAGVLRKTRKALDITQIELAEKLNVSSQSITRWESGNGEPRDKEELTAKLDKLMGTPPETKSKTRPKKSRLLDQVVASLGEATLTIRFGDQEIQFPLDPEVAQSLVRKELAV